MSWGVGLDARLARELVARGHVSAKALVHARAVRERGFAAAPLGDLLVELEHVDAAALESTLADVTGAPIWDGKGLDVELARAIDLRRPNAVVVRRDALTVWFASTEPHDDALRNDVQFAASARRADPMVARAELVAWARGRAHPFDQSAFEQSLDAAARVAAFADDDLRARWDPDRGDATPPEAVAANLVLLRLAAGPPGACARVEAFDDPAVRCGACASFDETLWLGLDPAAGRAALATVIRRLKHMAALAPDAAPAIGWIQLRIGRRRCSFELLVEETAAGEAAVLMRRTPWMGAEPPSDEAWSMFRQHAVASEAAARAGRDDEREIALRATVDAAAQLGPAALLEHVRGLWDLAVFLDDQQREPEARACANHALELILAHDLGARAEADLRQVLAIAETDDPSRRASLCERAEALLGAPGVGRQPTARLTLERATAARAHRQPSEALRAAEAALDDARRWFGGVSPAAAGALVEAAIAHADLGQAEASKTRAIEADAAARALDITAAPSRWALGLAELIAGRSDEALHELRAAADLARHDLDAPSRLWIEADLARALDAAGQWAEARAVAERAMHELKDTGAFGAPPRMWLATLLHRAGPYR